MLNEVLGKAILQQTEGKFCLNRACNHRPSKLVVFPNFKFSRNPRKNQVVSIWGESNSRLGWFWRYLKFKKLLTYFLFFCNFATIYFLLLMLFLYCTLIFTLRRKHGYMLGFFLATLQISPFIGIILNNSGIRFFAKLFKTVLPIQIKIMRIRIESFEDSDPDLSYRPQNLNKNQNRQFFLLNLFSKPIETFKELKTKTSLHAPMFITF